MECDFHGWATRNNLKCSDGRTIMKDAFKGNDGKTVPLVWGHMREEPANVLGHALLQNRDEGVYAFCTFNDTENGEIAKALVKHGDIKALSIYANKLRQQGDNVIHGEICEVSLVYAGANPGAYIESVIAHSDGMDEEAIIYTGEMLSLSHGEEDGSEDGEETLQEIYNTLTEKQKNTVGAIIAMALSGQNPVSDDEDHENEDKSKGGDKSMKHNVFDNDHDTKENTLSHSDMENLARDVFGDVKRYSSLRDSFLAHAADYGIENIDYLFPEAKTTTNVPEFIKRDMGWVQKVMGSVHHTPFSRIKSVFADITEDEARAKGYIKGKKKKEEVFSLLKRSTNPTTIYKKQKMDRDDVVDITDFDVVAWIKSEMRMMLDEEIARAVIIGDGRLASSDDKIDEQCIRPIIKDDDLYTVKTTVNVGTAATDDDKAKAFIRSAVKARKDYKGSGSPTLFTTEDVLTSCLLLTDGVGRDLYADEAQLAKKLRVKEIVTVPAMEGVTGKNGGALMGVIVNLNDYNIGADKGGAVNMFDDFDIDYNAQKYLIETRCSGALIKPYSAIVLELAEAAPASNTGVPSSDSVG